MSGLLICSGLLFLFGLFTLLGIKSSFFVTQLVFFAVGIALFIFAKRLYLHFFKLNARFFYWFFVALLVLTFIIGIEAKGSRRWIDLYFFNFQASEFFKVFFILYFANYFSKNRLYEAQFPAFLRSLVIAGIPILIIFKQPDLATALTYIFMYTAILIFSQVPKTYLLKFTVAVTLILPLLFFSLRDYQKARIVGFLNPHLERLSTSYNMTQAIIAVGSGQLLGKGLGAGTQSELHFLPRIIQILPILP